MRIRILIATVSLMLAGAVTYAVVDSDSSDAQPPTTSSTVVCHQPLPVGPAVACVQ